MKSILAFFGPLASSVRGAINFAELGRATLTALGASSALALAITLVNAINSDAAAIFSPSLVGTATFGLGLILDLLRRLQHVAPADHAP